MLRTVSLHSFSDDRSSPLLSNHHAKYEKSKKDLPFPFQPRSPLAATVFSPFCLFVGVVGIVFFLYSVFRPKSLPVFPCGRTEDTFQPFYSLPSARRLGLGGDSVGIADRPKFLGFVRIQTRFSSDFRRAALRNTWLPSVPDGLLRFMPHGEGEVTWKS